MPTSSASPSPEGPRTLSVPQAGRLYFGLSRNASYAAAQRGEIPTIRIGRLLRVPVAALDRALEACSVGAVGHGRENPQE